MPQLAALGSAARALAVRRRVRRRLHLALDARGPVRAIPARRSLEQAVTAEHTLLRSTLSSWSTTARRRPDHRGGRDRHHDRLLHHPALDPTTATRGVAACRP